MLYLNYCIYDYDVRFFSFLIKMVYYLYNTISHIGDYMLITTVYTYLYNYNHYAFDMCIMTYYYV